MSYEATAKPEQKKRASTELALADHGFAKAESLNPFALQTAKLTTLSLHEPGRNMFVI
jgi:hypothetical protein